MTARLPSEPAMVHVDAELLQLARAYLAKRIKEVATLQKALQRGDYEALRAIGHNLCGSGRSFGFDEVTAIGAGLEAAAAARRAGEIERLIGRLEQYLQRVRLKPVERRTELQPQNAGSILVVDDQRLNRLLVCRCLEKAGYEVKQAASGEEALALLEREAPPSLILLDVVMSGMSGLDMCRSIKSNPRTAGIAVIIFTIAEREDDRARIWNAGADGFLPKPLNREELLAKVGAVLERALVRTG